MAVDQSLSARYLGLGRVQLRAAPCAPQAGGLSASAVHRRAAAGIRALARASRSIAQPLQLELADVKELVSPVFSRRTQDRPPAEAPKAAQE